MDMEEMMKSLMGGMKGDPSMVILSPAPTLEAKQRTHLSVPFAVVVGLLPPLSGKQS